MPVRPDADTNTRFKVSDVLLRVRSRGSVWLSAWRNKYVAVAWTDVDRSERALAAPQQEALWAFQEWAWREHHSRYERIKLLRVAEIECCDWHRLDDTDLDAEVSRAIQRGHLVLLRLPEEPLVPTVKPVTMPTPPTPAPRRTPQDKLYEYPVVVLDDTGVPVAGARIKMEIDGTPRMATTDTQGKASAFWIADTKATVWLLNVSALRDQLARRWQLQAASLDALAQQNCQPFEAAARTFPAQSGSPTTIVLTRPKCTLRIKWLDLGGNPVSAGAVTVANAAMTTDGDGLVEASVDKDAQTVPLALADVASGLSLGVGSLKPSSDAGASGWKARLFSLGFLWDPDAEDGDEEVVLALQDFQAHCGLTISGQLDDATRAEIEQVFGC
jgi:hypothetical protein